MENEFPNDDTDAENINAASFTSPKVKRSNSKSHQPETGILCKIKMASLSPSKTSPSPSKKSFSENLDEISNCSSANERLSTPKKNASPMKKYYNFVLQSHQIVIKKQTKMYSCDVCTATYRHVFSLKRHFLRNHVTIKYISKSDINNCKIICHDGSDDVPTILDLDETSHLSLASENKKKQVTNETSSTCDMNIGMEGLYRCHLCPDTTFDTKEELQSHYAAHPSTSKVRFPCSKCGAVFSHKQTLLRHIATHANSSTFLCKICGKHFGTKASYIKHSKAHGDNRKCKYCSKILSTTANKRRHERIHEGLKPYPCKRCDSQFSQSSDLKKHLKQQHGVSYFSCNLCRAVFASKVTLNKHLRDTHAVETIQLFNEELSPQKDISEVPKFVSENADVMVPLSTSFACTVCKRNFPTYVIMLRHRRQCHPSYLHRRRVPKKIRNMESTLQKISQRRDNHWAETDYYNSISFEIANNLLNHVDGKTIQLSSRQYNFNEHLELSPSISIPSWSSYNFPDDFDISQLSSNKEYENKTRQYETFLPFTDHFAKNGFEAFYCDSNGAYDFSCRCNSESDVSDFEDLDVPINCESDLVKDKTVVIGRDVQPIYMCCVCKEKFNSHQTFDNHCLNNHPSVLCTCIEIESENDLPPSFSEELSPEGVYFTYKIPPPVSEKPAIICTKCKSVFSTAPDLHQHIINCGGKETVTKHVRRFLSEKKIKLTMKSRMNTSLKPKFSKSTTTDTQSQIFSKDATSISGIHSKVYKNLMDFRPKATVGRPRINLRINCPHCCQTFRTKTLLNAHITRCYKRRINLNQSFKKSRKSSINSTKFKSFEQSNICNTENITSNMFNHVTSLTKDNSTEKNNHNIENSNQSIQFHSKSADKNNSTDTIDENIQPMDNLSLQKAAVRNLINLNKPNTFASMIAKSETKTSNSKQNVNTTDHANSNFKLSKSLPDLNITSSDRTLKKKLKNNFENSSSLKDLKLGNAISSFIDAQQQKSGNISLTSSDSFQTLSPNSGLEETLTQSPKKVPKLKISKALLNKSLFDPIPSTSSITLLKETEAHHKNTTKKFMENTVSFPLQDVPNKSSIKSPEKSLNLIIESNSSNKSLNESIKTSTIKAKLNIKSLPDLPNTFLEKSKVKVKKAINKCNINTNLSGLSLKINKKLLKLKKCKDGVLSNMKHSKSYQVFENKTSEIDIYPVKDFKETTTPTSDTTNNSSSNNDNVSILQTDSTPKILLKLPKKMKKSKKAKNDMINTVCNEFPIYMKEQSCTDESIANLENKSDLPDCALKKNIISEINDSVKYSKEKSVVDNFVIEETDLKHEQKLLKSKQKLLKSKKFPNSNDSKENSALIMKSGIDSSNKTAGKIALNENMKESIVSSKKSSHKPNEIESNISKNPDIQDLPIICNTALNSSNNDSSILKHNTSQNPQNISIPMQPDFKKQTSSNLISEGVKSPLESKVESPRGRLSPSLEVLINSINEKLTSDELSPSHPTFSWMEDEHSIIPSSTQFVHQPTLSNKLKKPCQCFDQRTFIAGDNYIIKETINDLINKVEYSITQGLASPVVVLPDKSNLNLSCTCQPNNSSQNSLEDEDSLPDFHAENDSIIQFKDISSHTRHDKFLTNSSNIATNFKETIMQNIGINKSDFKLSSQKSLRSYRRKPKSSSHLINYSSSKEISAQAAGNKFEKSTILRCPHCTNDFENFLHLRRHINSCRQKRFRKAKQESLSKSTCVMHLPKKDVVEESMLNLLRHQSRQSEIMKEVKADENEDGKRLITYTCNICNKIFFSLFKLCQHRVVHKLKTANDLNSSTTVSSLEQNSSDLCNNQDQESNSRTMCEYEVSELLKDILHNITSYSKFYTSPTQSTSSNSNSKSHIPSELNNMAIKETKCELSDNESYNQESVMPLTQSEKSYTEVKIPESNQNDLQDAIPDITSNLKNDNNRDNFFKTNITSSIKRELNLSIKENDNRINAVLQNKPNLNKKLFQINSLNKRKCWKKKNVIKNTNMKEKNTTPEKGIMDSEVLPVAKSKSSNNLKISKLRKTKQLNMKVKKKNVNPQKSLNEFYSLNTDTEFSSGQSSSANDSFPNVLQKPKPKKNVCNKNIKLKSSQPELPIASTKNENDTVIAIQEEKILATDPTENAQALLKQKHANKKLQEKSSKLDEILQCVIQESSKISEIDDNSELSSGSPDNKIQKYPLPYKTEVKPEKRKYTKKKIVQAIDKSHHSLIASAKSDNSDSANCISTPSSDNINSKSVIPVKRKYRKKILSQKLPSSTETASITPNLVDQEINSENINSPSDNKTSIEIYSSLHPKLITVQKRKYTKKIPMKKSLNYMKPLLLSKRKYKKRQVLNPSAKDNLNVTKEIYTSSDNILSISEPTAIEISIKRETTDTQPSLQQKRKSKKKIVEARYKLPETLDLQNTNNSSFDVYDINFSEAMLNEDSVSPNSKVDSIPETSPSTSEKQKKLSPKKSKSPQLNIEDKNTSSSNLHNDNLTEFNITVKKSLLLKANSKKVSNSIQLLTKKRTYKRKIHTKNLLLKKYMDNSKQKKSNISSTVELLNTVVDSSSTSQHLDSEKRPILPPKRKYVRKLFHSKHLPSKLVLNDTNIEMVDFQNDDSALHQQHGTNTSKIDGSNASNNATVTSPKKRKYKKTIMQSKFSTPNTKILSPTSSNLKTVSNFKVKKTNGKMDSQENTNITDVKPLITKKRKYVRKALGENSLKAKHLKQILATTAVNDLKNKHTINDSLDNEHSSIDNDTKFQLPKKRKYTKKAVQGQPSTSNILLPDTVKEEKVLKLENIPLDDDHESKPAICGNEDKKSPKRKYRKKILPDSTNNTTELSSKIDDKKSVKLPNILIKEEKLIDGTDADEAIDTKPLITKRKYKRKVPQENCALKINQVSNPHNKSSTEPQITKDKFLEPIVKGKSFIMQKQKYCRKTLPKKFMMTKGTIKRRGKISSNLPHLIKKTNLKMHAIRNVDSIPKRMRKKRKFKLVIRKRQGLKVGETSHSSLSDVHLGSAYTGTKKRGRKKLTDICRKNSEREISTSDISIKNETKENTNVQTIIEMVSKCEKSVTNSEQHTVTNSKESASYQDLAASDVETEDLLKGSGNNKIIHNPLNKHLKKTLLKSKAPISERKCPYCKKLFHSLNFKKRHIEIKHKVQHVPKIKKIVGKRKFIVKKRRAFKRQCKKEILKSNLK